MVHFSLWILEEDNGEDDEPHDGHDHQCRDEHALPVAVAAGRGHELLIKRKRGWGLAFTLQDLSYLYCNLNSSLRLMMKQKD
jgi:hypothetical protein